MRASINEKLGSGFAIREVELADPLGREVLVEVKASGLCHSDHTAASVDLGFALPQLLGHEVSGVVAEIGPDVRDLVVGDHVVACLLQYCGACVKCLSGKVYLCRNPAATLRTADQPPRITLDGAPVRQGFGLGGFAPHALIHEAQLVRIPDQMPFAPAALLGCGGVTGAGAVLNTAHVHAGESVVIIGAGGVGLNAINGALIAGASPIIAIDLSAGKLETARTFGATHLIDSTHTDPITAVNEITGGHGADAVIDVVGIPRLTEQAYEMVAAGGGLYLVGVADFTGSFSLPQAAAQASQRRIEGVRMGSTLPRRDIPMLCDLYLQGRIKLDELVSREISLDEIDQGYEIAQDPSVARVVITSF
jgi:S-(hydroxymethyl)glutathione dehydrogenase / alcohol dehydrogenase